MFNIINPNSNSVVLVFFKSGSGISYNESKSSKVVPEFFNFKSNISRCITRGEGWEGLHALFQKMEKGALILGIYGFFAIYGLYFL